MTMRFILSSVFLIFACSVKASTFAPAVLWPAGEFSEKSPFPLMVYRGISLFEKFQDTRVQRFRGPGIGRTPETIISTALAGNFNPIFAFGLEYYDVIKDVAAQNPDTLFVIVDNPHIDAPNVASVSFLNEEGGFLMGSIAATVSQSNQIGFVGGMDIGVIRDFACGYAQGAKKQNSEINIVVEMLGDTPIAFNNPDKAKVTANKQYDLGVDVIFHAAGGSGAGVLEAAAEQGKLAIGVDANQNGVQPGNVLTSMLKRVDVVTYSLLVEASLGRLQAGAQRMGIRDGAIDWAVDEHNIGLLDAKTKAVMDRAMADIVAGNSIVHRYSDSNGCPYLNLQG